MTTGALFYQRPKTTFNLNEKCSNLIDVANGILPTCSDAEKTLKYLHLKVDICCVYNLCFFIYFMSYFFLVFSKDTYYYCVIHVSGQGLFSEAKRRPKGGSWIKLPFYDSMQDKMLELRRDI
jgi:hypothetical protein